MKPRLQQHFAAYEAYHRDPVNVAIHKVAVPAILFHVVVMLDWIAVAGEDLTLGIVVAALAGVWYAAVSPRYALVIIPFAFACIAVGRVVPRSAVVVLAVVAWVAQLVGHARFERRAPAFTDNLLQLLVGPAYIVALLLGDWPARAQDDRRTES